MGEGWWQASDGKFYPPQPAPAAPVEAGKSTMFRPHYESEVNRGSLNMRTFTATLNSRWNGGWRLSHLFEQDGNTVMVWERRTETR